jgi:deoxyhypusine synthase
MSSMPRPPALNLKQLRRTSVTERPSKVAKDSFAKVTPSGSSFRTFTQNLPRILAAQKFHQLVEAIASAHRRRRPVLAMMGAHVLKVGLSPLIVDLIERKVITAIAMTGSGIIHDFELAYQGQTSEEVAEALADGSFGMARETADFLNGAIKEGADEDLGIGESVGRMIERKKLRYRNLSLFAAAHRAGIPATVHVAIGADIIHQHPSCDGAALGKASLADFHRLAQVVSRIGEGAVVLNIGSAVILPEVFLKAVSISRNLGHPVKDFTAANLDMIQHYRPRENVLSRPTALGGQSIAITGHHELMVPLLHAAILEKIAK